MRIKNILYTDRALTNLTMRVATYKLFRSKNVGTMENIVLVNLTRNRIIGPSSDNITNEVNFSDEMLYALTNNIRKDKFAIIHNHPNNSGLSIMDLAAFLNWPSLKILVAVANNLQYYYVVYKQNTTLRIERATWEIFNRRTKMNQGHYPIDEFIPFLESRGFIVRVY